ncbi:hypothetical protein BGW36DRAFT_191994 [Talaromyces proteolyticus]|uniref:Uncharacterized protein n=1 Tax=Talaromyces proteolyticus TaxID=1131652 RepID=A0AAD4KRC7_9EURO|nr:uncharacterized protein BGW36DRAFT_191994 [Talaromyces proteolyticus]KAH8694862.1 hypothetical protein BGW36DRAFT_191994 [Talaromyces proteolyticus]
MQGCVWRPAGTTVVGHPFNSGPGWVERRPGPGRTAPGQVRHYIIVIHTEGKSRHGSRLQVDRWIVRRGRNNGRPWLLDGRPPASSLVPHLLPSYLFLHILSQRLLSFILSCHSFSIILSRPSLRVSRTSTSRSILSPF